MAGWGDQSWGSSWGGVLEDPDQLLDVKADRRVALAGGPGDMMFQQQQSLRYRVGDFGHDLVLEVLEPDSSSCLDNRVDLTLYDVKAIFSKKYERVTLACGRSTLILSTTTIFERSMEKYRFRLAPIHAAIDGETVEAPLNPLFPQRISASIAALDDPGIISIRGKDLNGNDLYESVDVSSEGVVYTSAQFAHVEEYETQGQFTVDLFVSNGKVRHTWENGDLSELGQFSLDVELTEGVNSQVSIQQPIGVFVYTKLS